MILYDESKNRIDINYQKEIGSGSSSTVYLYNNNKCIKLYHDEDFGVKKIDKKIYQTIKKINSKNLVNIISLLFDEKGNIKGYLMDYYKNKKFSFLDKNSEHTIHIYNELLKLFNELSSNNILLDDVRVENIIYSNNKIIIIDPDSFIFEDNVKEKNNMILINLFKNIYRMELENYIKLDYSKDPYCELNSLFDEEFIKTLTKHKYPKDYFLRR